MVVLRSKVAMVGDGTVGKSAVTQMAYSGGVTFPKNYMMTQGCDLLVKEIPIGDDGVVELFVHDIGGQLPFWNEVSDHLQGVDAFIAVFDVSSKISFENVHKWVQRIRDVNKDAFGVLLCNKMDLKDKAEVMDSQMEAWAKNKNLHLMQSSALRGVGVIEPFQAIAQHVADSYAARTEFVKKL